MMALLKFKCVDSEYLIQEIVSICLQAYPALGTGVLRFLMPTPMTLLNTTTVSLQLDGTESFLFVFNISKNPLGPQSTCCRSLSH